MGKDKDKDPTKEKPITDKQEKYIGKILSGDDCLFKGNVKWARSESNSKGGGKFTGGTCVISPYRLFILKAGKLSDSIEQSVSVLDILELGGFGTERFTVKCAMPKTKDILAFFMLEITGSKVQQMIQALRSAARIITNGCPEDFEMKITVPINNLLPLDRLVPFGPAAGFIPAYRAWVDYWRKEKDCQVNHELIMYVTDRETNTELDVGEVPGVEKGSSLLGLGEKSSFDLLPMFQALKFNVFYKSLSMNNIGRKEAVSYLAGALRYNRVLTKITVRNENSPSGFAEIGQALRDNKQHAIGHIDFAHSSLGDKALLSISEALIAFPHGLQTLDLSNTELNDKSLCLLFQSLQRNFGMSLTIEHLNLSGNKFHELSSTELANWLVNMKEHSSLRVMKVADANLNMVTVTRGIRVMEKLQELVVRGNKVDHNAALVLVNIAEAFRFLTALDVSDCNLTTDDAIAISRAYLANQRPPTLKFSIGKNDISASAAGDQIQVCVQRSMNLHTLDITGLRLKERTLQALLFACAQCRTLDTLILDDCFKGNLEEAAFIAKALGEMLQQNPSIRTLSMNGSFHRVVPIFLREHLASNITLLELMIADNKLGDEGAYAVAELLRRNKVLTYLNVDDNGFSLNGWLSIRNGALKNSSISSIQYPVKDTEKIFKDLPDQRHINMRRLLYDLRYVLNPAPVLRNQEKPPQGSYTGVISAAFVPQNLAAVARNIQLPPELMSIAAPAGGAAAANGYGGGGGDYNMSAGPGHSNSSVPMAVATPTQYKRDGYEGDLVAQHQMAAGSAPPTRAPPPSVPYGGPGQSSVFNAPGNRSAPSTQYAYNPAASSQGGGPPPASSYAPPTAPGRAPPPVPSGGYPRPASASSMPPSNGYGGAAPAAGYSGSGGYLAPTPQAPVAAHGGNSPMRQPSPSPMGSSTQPPQQRKPPSGLPPTPGSRTEPAPYGVSRQAQAVGVPAAAEKPYWEQQPAPPPTQAAGGRNLGATAPKRH